MKCIKYFIFIFIILGLNEVFGETINGVEIPEYMAFKLKEFRQKMAHDNALGAKCFLDFSVNELNRILKKQVKYDDTCFCPVCHIYFPVNSKVFIVQNNKDEAFCLDGFPEHIRFSLPPECPFCRCFCPNGDYDYNNLTELYFNTFCSSYEFACQHENPVERYIYILECLNDKITEYQKFCILYKFAVCYNPKNKDEILGDSLIELEKFFERNKKSECCNGLDFRHYLARIDIYRQAGRFELASKYISELKNLSEKKQCPKNISSVFLLEKEKELVEEKCTERVKTPICNAYIAAMNQNIKAKDFITKNRSQMRDEPKEQLLEAIKFAIIEKQDDWVKFIAVLRPDILLEKDCYGNTVLHVAAKLGCLEIVKFLLENRSDINALNMQKQSPLFLAIRYDRLEIFEYLLEHGAKWNIVDFENNSPMQVACIGHNKNAKVMIKKLLKLYQKHENIESDHIHNCYSIIISRGSKETLNYLRKLSNVSLDLSKIRLKGQINAEMIPIIAELAESEEFLYDDFFYSFRNKFHKKIEAYKSIKLYEKLLTRYQKDISSNG